MRRRIVLVGASGVFGSRLAAMLAPLPGVELVLAARSRPALEALARRLEGAAGARVGTELFDRLRPQALAALSPWLVVDAAGPFQGADYGLALAAVRAGAHYVDLADGRAFVAGFAAAVDEAAKAAGVLAVTGASSTPALSHAALHALVDGWRRIDDVTVVISPGARAPRGPAVVRAILSYVGRPVRVWGEAGWREVPGWSGLRRVDMPGVGRRFASVCETPDLDLLPARFPVRRSALFLAGLELAPMHLGLGALAWLVRLGVVRTLTPLAPVLRAAAGMLAAFGSDRGGMTVEATGLDARGEPTLARWALWAQAGAGPSTPAAPAAALVRALTEGRELRRGAMTAAGLRPLAEIVAELADLPIATARREGHLASPALFRRLAGRDFDALPAAVRAVHAGLAPATHRGAAVARAGRSLPAGLLRRTLGLPRSGRTPVTVTIQPDARGETWTRSFGAARFASRLVQARALGSFEERIWPLRFVFDCSPAPAA